MMLERESFGVTMKQSIEIEVSVEHETVWLNRQQLAIMNPLTNFRGTQTQLLIYAILL